MPSLRRTPTPTRSLKKRYGLAASLGVASLLLTACGGGGSEGSDDPIKIGALMTLSGPAGDIGKDQRDGLEIAAEQLNDKGGILGRQVKLVIKDDEGDPTAAARAMRELVDKEGVEAMFGPTLSSPTLAAANIAIKGDVLEMHTASAMELSEPAKYPTLFAMAPGVRLQATTFIEYMNENGLKKPGIVAVNNALGEQFIATFEELVKGTDIETVDTEYFETGAVDLVPQMTKLKGASADVILAINTAIPDQIATVKSRNQLNWDVPVLGFSTMANPLVGEGAGDLSGVYAGQVFKTLTVGSVPPAVEDFLELLRERRGTPTLDRDASQSAAAFDALMLIAEAAEGVGDIEDAAALAEYLETHAYQGVKASYEFTDKSHIGEGTDDLAFVVADSFADGVYEPANKD